MATDDHAMTEPHQDQPCNGLETSGAPIFLVGTERSGTTLLRLMLDHHPKLAFQFESEYMVQFVGDDGAMPDPKWVVDTLATDRIFNLAGFTSDTSGDYPQLVNGWLEQKRQQDGKPIVGATIHTHFDRAPYIWPDAKYIHLLRDPRDVANSCVVMGWYGNAYAATDHWVEAMRCWDALCEKVPEDRRLLVRYEDLIENPVDTLTGICSFLGIEYDQAIFDYIDGSTYHYPDPKLTYQWKRKMPEDELRRVEGKIGDEMVKRGYELSGKDPIKLSPSEVQKVYKQSDWGRRRFALKRFGLMLMLAENLGRRLKLKGLHDWAVVRKNAIEAKHIR